MKVNHQNSKWFKAALSLFCLNMAATLDQGKQLFNIKVYKVIKIKNIILRVSQFILKTKF